MQLLFFVFIRKMATGININNLWSNSNTTDVLTPYAEGCACDSFDNKRYYNVHCNTSLSWFVLNKEVDSSPSIDDSISNIRFDRVIVVQIDEHEFISCSCGYCQRFLLPCFHVCAVLKDIKYYEPSLFHLRWYKSVSYYYAHDFSSKIAPQTNEALKTMLDETCSSHYRASGK